VIAKLLCRSGIETVTAFGLCREIADFRRFDHPGLLAGDVGIMPSEHSAGEQVKRGAITKAGSSHARRLLVEAAQQNSHEPAIA
jgi:transposase